MEKEADRTDCIRCGECCLRSSPTLHQEDISLLRKGVIKKGDLLTVRKGELVRDNIHEDITVTPHEMIKVKEREDEIRGGCKFYDRPGKACRIYEKRPVQCSALKCWDTTDFLRVYKGPKLERKALIDDGTLLGLIEEHDRRCSYASLEGDVKKIEREGERAIERIIDRLKFDFHLRPFISEKLGISPIEMDFFFGRPLIRTLPMFGLKAIQEPDGSFLLTPIK